MLVRHLLVALPLTFCACFAETEGAGTQTEAERESMSKKGEDKDHDGFTVAEGDCNDEDERAHPGQKKSFSKPHKLASGELSFDFDCDGAITRDDDVAVCLGAASPEGETCTCAPGWSGDVPECGATGFYSTATACGFTPKEARTQACR